MRERFGVILFSLFFASVAAAQLSRNPCINFPCPALQSCISPADAPSCVADSPTRCSVVTVYTHGLMDSFAQPVDPTTPSPTLTTFLGAAISRYDTASCNQHFGDSFPVGSCLNCKFCGAKVEIHLKPCGSDQPGNDDYVIGVAPFGTTQILASGRIWPTGVTPREEILVVNIPADKLNQLFCNVRVRPPTLDVYVEDDTIVDWVRVTIYSS
ncbi:MAG TPA: hypothetical protein VNN25_05225 [Thermoanaerobaculia bacterium]|nr:hypothetical protein [Thermoanaerobaculia bacterium]